MKKNKNLKTLIRKSIIEVLKEEAENDNQSNQGEQDSENAQSGVISTKGAFGSGGRAKKFVTSAGARAKEDPEGLLRDLGVTKQVSGSDLDQALKVLNTAIHSNTLMSRGYIGAKQVSEVVKGDSGQKPVIAIKTSELDRKNGVRFLAHTLTAAVNAGIMNLRGGLQFGTGESSEIVIYTM